VDAARHLSVRSGTASSVTIRNNTGTAGKSVVADAVQFVPRLSPWGNATNTLADYTVTTFADDISGTSLDATKWQIALGRPNVSVADGKISLDIEYIARLRLRRRRRLSSRTRTTGKRARYSR